MGRFLLLMTLLVSFVSAGQSMAAQAPANVLISTDRTEPSIAVDPRNPGIVVVGSNTNYDLPLGNTFPVGYFASQNGGVTFGAGDAPVVSPWTTEADPSMAIGNHGTVFFTYLAESPSFCSAAGGSAVITSRSYDHGRSFHAPTIVDNNPEDDKPFSTVENMGAGRNHLFVTWTRDEGNSEAIWLARSANGGDSFSPPIRLYISNNNNFGSVPVVGPHGHVYVAWSSYVAPNATQSGKATLLIRASSDDGRRFWPVHRVSKPFTSLPTMAQPGALRNETFPSMTAGSDGTLYITWAQVTKRLTGGATNADIMVSRSTDGGTSWSTPRHVNDVRNGDRFMPSISLLSDGTLGVAFYDRRHGPWNLDVYAVHISFTHGFHRSAGVRVTAGTSPVGDIYFIKPGHSSCFYPGRFFGDYIGAAGGAGGTLDVVWADTQAHVYPRTDIWFARVTLPVLGSATRTHRAEIWGATAGYKANATRAE